ncbi:3-dehydroquinate synthase [Coriobacteriia bacterium Es71-Z0120]|uniref:3-dehydroquinate synthase n=1 Tax=Parvivirga hydrogeniphila TaxID=2939460 RepID=UPI002260EBC3|nr:3-dehydroquinate synthase [Parvivirga hydrogeniphila]MCL4079144.1 3-dehydroquinate synthase [Parvivirga hydrogeniphila]
MSHVFLTGFMGSGKSTVGRIVAERLGLPFVDLDEEIERRAGRSVSEIFRGDGEEAFREAEHAALLDAVRGLGSVVACGGGVVLRNENRRLLKEHGTVVYLAVSADEALARIGDASDRPLLAGDARAIAPRILDARLSLYRATADLTVDTTGRAPSEVADEVVRLLQGQAFAVVQVRTEPQYEVVVGHGAVQRLPEIAAAAAPSGTVALVTDETVVSLHGDAVRSALESAGLSVAVLAVPPKERSKSWETAGALLERLASLGLDRKSAVVALGGGVIGDLAGFAASVYMRGVPVVHVPTTLLAQVDSSIGGKTGVDLATGKNLAGTFWQPFSVLTDQDFLHTLPDAEWQNGWAEAVKTALLAGGPFWERVERDAAHLAARDDAAVSWAVESCVRFKADVVSRDARESAGIRECLNLGHTLGHAIEREAGYGVVPHGVAVAEGLRFAARLSVALCGASADLPDRIDATLDALGVARAPREGMTVDGLMRAMRTDKKAIGGTIRFVLLTAPGAWVTEAVPEAALAEALGQLLDEGGAPA